MTAPCGTSSSTAEVLLWRSRTLAGKVALADGTFTLVDCKLQSGGANYAVKGTASYDRSLAVRLERPADTPT